MHYEQLWSILDGKYALVSCGKISGGYDQHIDAKSALKSCNFWFLYFVQYMMDKFNEYWFTERYHKCNDKSFWIVIVWLGFNSCVSERLLRWRTVQNWTFLQLWEYRVWHSVFTNFQLVLTQLVTYTPSSLSSRRCW